MSAVWVKITALLCLSSTVHSGPDVKSEVVWRFVGGSITIQCRCPDTECKSPDTLYVKRALNKDVDVYFKGKAKEIITKGFQGRLQVAGNFPNLEILIKNLSSEDTGPYWCIYNNVDMKSDAIIAKGSGSVLLVVQEGVASGEAPRETCSLPAEKLVLFLVVISAAVLLCIIMGILMCCIKKKMDGRGRATKPRRIPNNDVYEDMRGTLRR